METWLVQAALTQLWVQRHGCVGVEVKEIQRHVLSATLDTIAGWVATFLWQFELALMAQHFSIQGG